MDPNTTDGKKNKRYSSNRRYLPDDMVLSILSKFTVKSLVRFASVSQSWNARIKSDYVPALNPMNNKKFSLIYFPTTLQEQGFTIVRESHALPPRNSAFPLGLGGGGYTVIGVCEGLICLEKESVMYIWNPVINNILRIIPNVRRAEPETEQVFGFGFSQENNDYRVVKIVHASQVHRYHRPIRQIEMYSLVSNSWRNIQLPDFPSTFLSICSSSGVFNQRCIYWLGSVYPGRYCIYSFDVDSEILCVEGPTRDRTNFEIKLNDEIHLNLKAPELAVANGFLVLFQFDRGGLEGRAWIFTRTMRWGFPPSCSLNKFKESGHYSKPNLRIDLVPIVEEYEKNYKRMVMTTKGGHVILEDIRDRRLFSCDCYCDGKSFSFKFRDLGIYNTAKEEEEEEFHILPMVETLFL